MFQPYFVYFSTLQSKFGESSREFSKSDNKVHYFVLLNPNNLDMFMFITVHEEKIYSVSFDTMATVVFDKRLLPNF